jgi:hypothetical protein
MLNNIALPVSALTAYAAAPTKEHHAALVDIVRYVGSTAARGITYGGKQKPLGFWCDANFAACQDTRRSTTGWVVTMYGGSVSWSSKKQATTAASTKEAEYQACAANRVSIGSLTVTSVKHDSQTMFQYKANF